MDKIKVHIVQRPAVDICNFIANATRLTFKNNYEMQTDIRDTARKSDVSIVQNLIKSGHSPSEHCSFSLLIEGASRSFLAQVRTHRIGISFTSASQHYINQTEMGFVVPYEVYKTCEQQDSVDPLKYFIESYKRSFNDYQEAQKLYGLDHSVTRQMTPQSARNSLLITANIRTLLKLLALRECGRNTSEIKHVMFLIREALIKECPEIFTEFSGPDCFTKGKCPEYGSLCCGHPWDKNNPVDPNKAIADELYELAAKWRKIAGIE